jgi:2-haloacid dehalogenase
MNSPKAFVFDAYGTLFDVHSVLAQCEDAFPGIGQQLTKLWRSKQLEYTWLRSLMGRYEDFWHITKDALVYSCQSLGLQCSPQQIDRLLRSYLTLSPFPDAAPALDRLTGTRCAILSNGTPQMLDNVVRHAGFEGRFELVLSVDAVKVYKPHPAVYGMAVLRLGLERNEIGFVSSNAWDVVGAKAFGFQTFWLNRSNAPLDILGATPDKTISTALEIVKPHPTG